MENITIGHWIFGGISLIVFLIYIFWSYFKDRKIYTRHYKGVSIFALVIIVAGLLLYFSRQFLKQ